MKNETRRLKCHLTDQEIRDRLASAARQTCEDKALALAEVDRIAAKLKDAKASVQAIQATIDAKLDIANRGWEHRDVECEWVAVGDGREALLRSDTGEAIEARETPRQRELVE